MIHHTVAQTFVSTKLRDLGPKSSAYRTFWRMVAACIRYQPLAQHFLSDLTTFSLASVKIPCLGTGFLGLAYALFPQSDDLDDIPEIPLILPICSSIHVTGSDAIFELAMATPLPHISLLETVMLSLKEGQVLSESTMRRLRRKDVEMRAAAAEGRAPLSEYKMRKQKRVAAKTSTAQGLGISENETLELHEQAHASISRMHPQPKHVKNGLRKVSVEDIEKPATSVTTRRRPG